MWGAQGPTPAPAPPGAAGPARALRAAIGLASVLVATATVPRVVCGRPAGAYVAGEAEAQDELARDVARAVLGQRELTFYHTGNERFDGQSAVAAYQMAALGLGQIALDHPERREGYLPALRRAADRLADPRTLRYAARRWGQHAATRLGPGEGHAYAGYINLGLGIVRALDPETPHAALHDRLTRELERRLEASPTGLIETYPGETFPPDVAAVAGSIGLHASATGRPPPAWLEAWAERFARCAVDGSGYLVQQVKSGSCAPVDGPRGSGTAIAAYFLSFAHRGLSRRLHEGLKAEGRRTLFGFAAVREYARGVHGAGDVNAGPIIFGVSVGATGFALGSARAHGDEAFFRELYRSAHLFGAPVEREGARHFALGGALGNALLLAMLTARPG
ncbi:MAG TPA: hypothetical protein VFS43_12525 [Polyangiaceae bacterium]|nr:hypothetical protein [Polyangiaceae bacterium]